MKILSITGKLLFESNHDSIKATLEEAVRQGADLGGANLRGADLEGTYLEGADLGGANLYGSDLGGANLSGANLSGAVLRGAYLSGADLRRADLRGADLIGADLRGAYLSGADLIGADLRGAKGLSELSAAQLSILPDGDIIGWKKCNNNVIVKLLIPKEAKRSNATGRKCRAEYATVLEIIGGGVGVSQHDNKTTYRIGETIKPDSFDADRWNECSSGIHFFITRIEAEKY